MNPTIPVKVNIKTLNRIRERFFDEQLKSYNITLISFFVDYEEMVDEIEAYEISNQESFKKIIYWTKILNKTQDDLKLCIEQKSKT